MLIHQELTIKPEITTQLKQAFLWTHQTNQTPETYTEPTLTLAQNCRKNKVKIGREILP